MAPLANEIFVSYADTDKEWVKGYLLPLLEQRQFHVHTHEQFRPGESKIDEIERAIRNAQYTFLVFSPAYLLDTWTSLMEQLASYFNVRERQYALIPVMYQKCELPLRISFRVMLDFSDPARWDEERRRLLDFLGSGSTDQKEALPCPYPGMRPFGTELADIFFGRQPEIDQVIRIIRNQNFLCILGASGSGKSSLVFAGVLPRLSRSSLFEKDYWLVRDLRPGTNPLQKIREVLGSDCADVSVAVGELLAREPSAKRLLLIIDQFEEVFADVAKEEALTFMGIVEALRQVNACCVLITMRAAFYQDLMASNLWPISIAERLELVPLRGKALADAIECPAQQAGVYLEAGLLDLILHDAANEPGVLPLVQEVMILLWDKRQGKLITQAAYRSLGKSGLAVALAAKADATYLGLTSDRQRIAKRIFLRLIQFGEGRPDTRRQQSSAELSSMEDDKADFSYCLLYLVNNRLLTLGGEENDRAIEVDIAHESLIDGWPLLHSWITERREAEQARRRLQQKAEEWIRLGRQGAGLLDTIELAEAQNWIQGFDARELGYGKDIDDLISASTMAVEEEARVKRAAKEKEMRRLRGFVIGLTIAFLVALFAGSVAYVELHIARSRQYAAQALGISDHPSEALMAGQAGYLKNNNEDTRSSLLAVLQKSSQVLKFLHSNHSFAWSVKVSPDGRTLVSAHSDGTVIFWDLKTYRPIGEPHKAHERSVNIVEFSKDGRFMASASADGTVLLWDAARREVIRTVYHDPKNNVAALSFNADGRTLALAGTTRDIFLFDVLSPKRPADTLRAHTGTVNVVAFSPDGKLLASGSDDQTVLLWDTQTRRTVGDPLDQHDGNVYSLAWSPDGTRLASGSQTAFDGDASEVLILWDVATQVALGDALLGHSSAVFGLVFSLTGDTLFSCSADNTIIAWNLNNSTRITTFKGHRDQVNAVAITPDGKRLISTGWDDNIIVWNLVDANVLGKKIDTLAYAPMALRYLEGRQALMTVDGGGNIHYTADTGQQESISLQSGIPLPAPSSLAISKSLHVLAAGNAKGSVNFWDLTTGEKISSLAPAHKGKVTYMSMNRAGTMLAAGSDDGLVFLWDVAQHRVVSPPLKARLGRVEEISFNPDGRTVAVAYERDAVAFWDVASFRIRGNLTNLDNPPTALAYSPDGRWLAIGSGYGKTKNVTLMDPKSGSSTKLSIDELGSRMIKVAFSPNGKLLAAGTSDGKVLVWDMANLKLLKEPAVISGAGSINGLGFDSAGKMLAIGTQLKGLFTWEMRLPAPSGRFETERSIMDLGFIDEDHIAAVSFDSAVIVLGAQDLKPQPLLKDPVNEVMTCISMTADNRTVVLGRDRGDILLWQETEDHQTSTKVLPVKLEKGMKDLVIIGGSRIVVVAGKDSTLLLLDMYTGKERYPRLHLGDDISFITLSHDERILAVGKSSGSIVLLDARTFEPIGHSLEGHAKVINFMRFSPDDKYLASAGDDRMIYVWEVATRKPIGLPFMAHQGRVLTLAFSADGRWLASGGADDYINIWDIDKHTRFGGAFQTETPVKRLAFSADGRYLYSAGDDQKIMRWTLDPQDWLKAAGGIANN